MQAREADCNSRMLKKNVAEYERSLMQCRSTLSYDLLKKYKKRVEQMKNMEGAPHEYKSKLFPNPDKSQVDNWMPSDIYSRKQAPCGEKTSLNRYLSGTKSVANMPIHKSKVITESDRENCHQNMVINKEQE